MYEMSCIYNYKVRPSTGGWLLRADASKKRDSVQRFSALQEFIVNTKKKALKSAQLR